MHIQFVRFEQVGAFRHFIFSCVGEDRSKTEATVRADVGLVRKYDISLQDLPLVCSQMLSAAADGGLTDTTLLTFAEADMVEIRTARINKSLEKKKQTVTRPAPPNAGKAWRNLPL